MFPTEMVENGAKRKILRILSEKNKQYTIKELAEMCHRSESTVSRALKNIHRHSFLEKNNISGSKKLVFKLNPESRYTSAIKSFFEIERERERQNGTIPVDIWNLLEDVTNRFSKKIDNFLELFLYGSYATGEYHAGSNIDLLLTHTGKEKNAKKQSNKILKKTGDKRLQIITLTIKERKKNELSKEKILEEIKKESPVRKIDILIPLTGELA